MKSPALWRPLFSAGHGVKCNGRRLEVDHVSIESDTGDTWCRNWKIWIFGFSSWFVDKRRRVADEEENAADCGNITDGSRRHGNGFRDGYRPPPIRWVVFIGWAGQVPPGGLDWITKWFGGCVLHICSSLSSCCRAAKGGNGWDAIFSRNYI